MFRRLRGAVGPCNYDFHLLDLRDVLQLQHRLLRRRRLARPVAETHSERTYDRVCVCVCVTIFFSMFFRFFRRRLESVCVCVPSFSSARRCFPIFLGRLLGRRARVCSSLSFLGWPPFFLFSGGAAQQTLSRPLVRLSAAGSRVLPCETRAAAES